VNQHVIRSNKKNEENEPVVRVQQGSRTGYCHEVEITGKCRIIYSPNNPLGCGARVWIEVEPDVAVKPFIYADMSQSNSQFAITNSQLHSNEVCGSSVGA
ncbi:MAG: hypothetical protein AAFY76_24180, partial [Cyanobacteria bacterium J06649_11]